MMTLETSRISRPTPSRASEGCQHRVGRKDTEKNRRKGRASESERWRRPTGTSLADDGLVARDIDLCSASDGALDEDDGWAVCGDGGLEFFDGGDCYRLTTSATSCSVAGQLPPIDVDEVVRTYPPFCVQYPTVQASSTAARLTMEGVGVAAARVARAREAREAFMMVDCS